MEDAAVFLKDAVDLAGDELVEKMTSESFIKYKTKVKQFISYIVKTKFKFIIMNFLKKKQNIKS